MVLAGLVSPQLVAFGVAALLPIGVQLHSQWVCFGSWIHPPQTWMADANFTDLGYRGFAPPAADLYFDKLFEHRWGIFAYGPLLIIGLLPPRSRAGQMPLVSRREWSFGMVFLALFMLFCASNQYARMQWNTGVRYLMPVVPLLFLFACQHLARLPGGVLFLLAAPAVLHEWVLCLRRDNDLWAEWKSFLADGPRLPWLDVLSRTALGRGHIPAGAMPSMLVLAAGISLVVGLWWIGRRIRSGSPATTSVPP